jgi:hypothetical protein
MSHKSAREVIDELVEPLAAIEHERWSHWQRYLHSQCSETKGGMVQFAANLFHRWAVQIETPYANLSEKEKESDRQEVRRYLPLIEKALADQREVGRIEERERCLEISRTMTSVREIGEGIAAYKN